MPDDDWHCYSCSIFLRFGLLANKFENMLFNSVVLSKKYF